MTEEEFKKFVQGLRNKRARCSQYCSCWNDYDKDCEIYGEYHTPPSRCSFYLERSKKDKFNQYDFN